MTTVLLSSRTEFSSRTLKAGQSAMEKVDTGWSVAGAALFPKYTLLSLEQVASILSQS